ncbi:MAG TPA: flagellar filament capping protein FliD [Kofleriaceae bacterium]|jgi:flagellar hook-associated protein 2|nr:flagellar filament capping protein FliD [Kofleriaceae bacterium]
MTAITFSGLSSGLDTTSLINSLVAAERAPVNAITSHQSDLNTQKSIVGSLSSAVAALGTVMQGMNLTTELQPRTVTTSDSHVTVAASAGAASTVHDVRVQQLARGQISSSRTFTSADAGVVGDGSLTITTGTTSKEIDYSSSDSLASIASKINDAGAGASASVLFDGTSYRLMVAATATGSANAPQFTETGDALGLSDPDNIQVPAQDAKVTIDGVKDITRSSNVISDAVSGLTFTLVSPQAATDPSTQVSVGLDTDAITKQLNSLVSAYNSVNAALHVQLDYTGTAKGTNTLFGDSTLRQLQGALSTVMTSAYGPNTASANSLGAIGLTVAKDGSLTLDSSKLSSALATNPNAVSDLFVTGGFASAMTTMTDAYTAPVDGFLAAKTQSLTDQISGLQTQADQVNARADALQTQLQNQFDALETLMSSLKSQSSYLTSVLG